jgi:hypothetical protein
LAFLKIGVTRATFHSIGKLSVAIDILKILIKGSAIAGAAAFNTLAEISSIPVALEIVNLVISL